MAVPLIKDLKDLKHLLKLCRQNGVTEINWGQGSLKLGEVSRSIPGDATEIEEDNPMDALESPLSPEELAAYANGAM